MTAIIGGADDDQKFNVVARNGHPINADGHLLHVQDLRKAYGPKLVLENVDLRVRAGEFVALVGPSGCGKSTLLRLILGDEEPTSGLLHLDGKPVGYPDPSRGIVYQQYSLFPHLTVEQNVALGLLLPLSFLERCRQKRRILEEVRECLGVAQLFEHRHKYPHHLSGGQRQRVAVIQSLIKKPKVLLMDEPFGALDPFARERMQTFLLEQWERWHTTIILVTHDLGEAVFMATRVIVLSQYYTDGRNGIDHRGARIVCDVPVGRIGEAASTRSKLDPRFTATVEFVRDRGFKSDHRQHVADFDLRHPDSFHTVSFEELRCN